MKNKYLKIVTLTLVVLVLLLLAFNVEELLKTLGISG
ncbi:hypothetical protein SAMN06297358_3389 [Pedobacter xixiisoli]|uniref:Uncharacterized protein n=1 Tax=Pedobacter xixiisoli TaxID=1476464 RepID=A0A286ACR0_9SPHI|nr:hypothetical protein SAMN06297358_3389 [Pedobacter xixiisoli]